MNYYENKETYGRIALDAGGNPYSIEAGLSLYKDFQKFTLQEMPEKCPTGQMPRQNHTRKEWERSRNYTRFEWRR